MLKNINGGKKMAKSFKAILECSTMLLGNKTVRKVLLGEYSNGTPRSLPDCLDGEILSPKERKKYVYKRKKKLKKHKIKY